MLKDECGLFLLMVCYGEKQAGGREEIDPADSVREREDRRAEFRVGRKFTSGEVLEIGWLRRRWSAAERGAIYISSNWTGSEGA